MRSRTFLILAAALGTWLGHANPWLQFPLAALALPAGLAALGLDAETPHAAFKSAWIAGTLASLGCLYWVYWPVEHFGEVHWLLALPLPVLLSMAMAVYFGLFGLLAHVAGKRLGPLTVLPCLGLGWSVMELATGTLLSGFPWLNLAAAFVPWTIVALPAAYVGSYGLSGVLAAIAVGPVLARRSKFCAAISLALALAVCGLGWQHQNAYLETTPAHAVAVAQGNIDQSLKWNPSYQQETVAKYVRLSRSVAAQQPVLVVWPETAMPFYFQDDTPLRTPVLDYLRSANASLVLGSPAYELHGSGGYTLYNRAYLLGAPGTLPQWYDKEHLVPFGEYMPLAGWLPLQKLVNGVGDFAPGVNERALVTGDLALGVLLCYEGIFAGLSQERVSEGANLLVNISNDAWFGATSAPIQHLHLAAMRAIEQGRWVVRGTNTGLSAFIDPLGRIRLAGPQFAEVAAVGQVHPRAGLTVFHRAYDSLLVLAGLLCAYFAYRLLWPNRK